jgi:exodeoxyribonuclease VII large subunit
MDSPLLASLFDEEERRPWSVSELNSEIRNLLERSFDSVWVEGEITNFHAHGSGHWYFSLTDGEAFIKAACFKGQNYRIRFKPENGLQVRVRGKLSVYGPRGELQIVVDSLEPVGEGALLVAFEQIKARLLKEGLFDEALKQPIPAFPRKIGIVTSPTGAAVHDIMTVLARRARSVSVVIVPTLVQGERAGEQIVAAISLANEFNSNAIESNRIDVLIVGRGGGSAEDLWAFNEEQVARAIRASKIPVISAVGHEVDFTIADMAADLRAATPSAAAEIVAKAEAEVIDHLRRSTSELYRSMNMLMLTARTDVQGLSMSPVFSEFPPRLRDLRHRIDLLAAASEDGVRGAIGKCLERLRYAALRLSPVGLAQKVGENQRRLGVLGQRAADLGSHLTDARHRQLENAMARLDAMSPLRVLDRGYSLTQNADGQIIRDAFEAEIGDRIRIRLARGSLGAEVSDVSTG